MKNHEEDQSGDSKVQHIKDLNEKTTRLQMMRWKYKFDEQQKNNIERVQKC